MERLILDCRPFNSKLLVYALDSSTYYILVLHPTTFHWLDMFWHDLQEDSIHNKELMAEFPNVFDGQVRNMPREKFLTKEVFCNHTTHNPLYLPRETQTRNWPPWRPRHHHTSHGTNRVVCTSSSSTKQTASACVDLSKLNKYVRKENYPSTTPQELTSMNHQLHRVWCSQGVPSLPSWWGKPKANHIHHALWMLYVSPGTLRHIIHQWTL